MMVNTYPIYHKEEYTNPLKGEFIPNITSYLYGDEKVRPVILIVPGGGYRMVAIAESEIVAKKFYEKGYNTFVLSYTITMFENIQLHLQPLQDLSRAVTYIRKHAEEFRIDPKHLILCGFSAGGHLCGSLAVHYKDPQICQQGEYEGISNRPDAVILSYPVITTGLYAHKDSFKVLLGDHPSQEEKEYMSLEKHVTADTPPVFLWHTATDETVPVENSYLFAEACKKADVSYELHIFRNGPHGYSLANEEWASGEYGGDYVMNQWFAYMQYYIDNEIEIPAPFNEMKLPKGTDYREMYRNSPKDYLKGTANPSVAIWPELVDTWLKGILEEQDGEKNGR